MVAQANATYLVLGPTTVAAGSRSVDLGSPQRRGVLARLILSPGRSLSVDLLMQALWGEHPPPTARKAVQVQISRLRQVLPEGAIESSAAGYALQAAPADTDLGRFEDLVRTARLHPDAAAQSADLHRALALWRGPALADVADLPFAVGEAARLEELRQQALDGRVRADLELGHHASIVAELEGLVALHPEREPQWEHLMRALYGLGRQADALRAYERARTYLNEELGLDPGPALQALQLAVLRHDDSLLPQALVTPTRPERTTRSAGRPRRSTLLVGREPVLEPLRLAIERDAREQSGSLVIVEADEGFGKTAVLTAIADESASAATVLFTSAREDHAAPYAPWADVLVQLGAGDVASLLDGWADQRETGEWRRTQLFHGVASSIAQAAAAQPVVLLLDDAHWADEGTTRLLLHVLAETASRPVTTIVAWRPREVRVGAPAVALAAHVARVRATRPPLRPLGEPDIEVLVGRHQGPSADPAAASDQARRIFEVTGGVPLFVEDVIVSSGTDGWTSDADVPQVPETARSITARRLTGAGEVATQVARAAALLAEPISVDVLVDLLPELDVSSVLDGVDRLVEFSLLQETPAGPTFVHATFRAAVRDSTGAGRRLVLHANAFHRLSLEPGPAAALAQHAEGGGRLVPPTEAAAALDRAGREAADRGAFSDAARFFERELALVPETERAPALLNYADALWRAGELTPAKDVATSVADLRADQPDLVRDEDLARAVALHGTIGLGFRPDATSIAMAEAALEVITDPTARARCAGALAYHQAAWGAPIAVVEAALARARAELPDTCPDDLIDELTFTEGLATIHSPDLDLRRDVARLLIDRGRAKRDWRSIGRGTRLLCLAHLAARDLESVEASIGELDEAARRTGSWMYASDVYRFRIAVALARDELDRARTGIEDLDRLASAQANQEVFVGSQRLLLSHAEGDLTTSLHFVDAVRTALPPHDPWQTDRMLANLYRIRLLREMDRGDEAAQELDELAPWKELHLSSCRRYPNELAMISTAVAGAGRADVATALLPLVEPFRGQYVVLGWGEGIIGTFEDCWQQLDAVADEGASDRA